MYARCMELKQACTQELNLEGGEAGSDADGAAAEVEGDDGESSDFDDYIDALQHEGGRT